MSFRLRRPFLLICATALVTATMYGAQARDFEMGGDSVYNIMAPEPGTGQRHVTHNSHGRTSSRHSQSLTATQKADQEATQSAGPAIDTPEQIETYQRNRRAFAARGSSGIVLPTPVPGPTHYAPIGSGIVPFRSLPQEQPPTILPGSGRAIPNLSHGPETSQDRIARCQFQSSLNSVPNTQIGGYIHSCAM
jgi:hypothetical protein